MVEDVKKYIEEVKAFESFDLEKIEAFRINFLGKKGILNGLFSDFRKVPSNEKKSFGIELNKLKTAVTEKVRLLKEISKKKLGSNKIPLNIILRNWISQKLLCRLFVTISKEIYNKNVEELMFSQTSIVAIKN